TMAPCSRKRRAIREHVYSPDDDGSNHEHWQHSSRRRISRARRRHRQSPTQSSQSNSYRTDSAISESKEAALFTKAIRQLPKKLVVELPCGTIKKIADMLQSEDDETKPVQIIIYASDMRPAAYGAGASRPIPVERPLRCRINSRRSSRYGNHKSSRVNRSRRSCCSFKRSSHHH
ncbi:hypothetical protein Tcan_07133, partial [Toxocara canis]